MVNAVIEDAEILLDLLNTHPIIDGVPTDLLARPDAAQWLSARDLPHSPEAVSAARGVRDAVAAVIRQQEPAERLQSFLSEVVQTPSVDGRGLHWELHTKGADPFSLRCVLAWAWLQESLPGRLRPCDNDACGLFLLDRSRANTRRWCSMAVCGNRLKARRHYQRSVADADRLQI
jgi:predicted RNA-binding Zn ribbon-like protein